MKKMKHLKTISLSIMVLLMLSLLNIKANAQTGAAETRAQDLTETMVCELGLRTVQIPEIYAINLKAAKEMDSAKKVSGYNSYKLDDLGKIVDKNRNTSLRDALYPKQFSIYERISKGNKRMLKKTAKCRTRNPDNAKLESCAF